MKVEAVNNLSHTSHSSAARAAAATADGQCGSTAEIKQLPDEPRADVQAKVDMETDMQSEERSESSRYEMVEVVEDDYHAELLSEERDNAAMAVAAVAHYLKQQQQQQASQQRNESAAVNEPVMTSSGAYALASGQHLPPKCVRTATAMRRTLTASTATVCVDSGQATEKRCSIGEC